MSKSSTEIRDPVHVFIKLDPHERETVNSRPFQRLRYIRQLASAYLIYPGAAHSRFEHSLGVMELAGRIFDVITSPENLLDPVPERFPQLNNPEEKSYWRKVLRLAALCHDLGHLPFSHAAEKELLPPGWNHERISRLWIESKEMTDIWHSLTPPLRTDDIVRLALGPKAAPDLPFDPWQCILAEIISGDAFGADRMDYLLRDSHHTGVAYGKFDHYRLIDTLRILPNPPGPEDRHPFSHTALGVEEGGLHSAEALLLARYFMFSQVYFHRVRRICDIHLRDFLSLWLPQGTFPTNLNDSLALTDNEILAAIRQTAGDISHPAQPHAARFLHRNHFKLLHRYSPGPPHLPPNTSSLIYNAAIQRFGPEPLRHDMNRDSCPAIHFPVLTSDGHIYSSLTHSHTLQKLPCLQADFIFISPELRDEAQIWLKKNLLAILAGNETMDAQP